MNDRRLIESRLPLKEVSSESARGKSIRHGHISTLHIWWARRPLAASRAAVFGTLVPDSDENYELVKRIVPWEAVKDGNNEAIQKARQRILEANGGKPPRVLDPFSGGGAIPLEALRLGAETYALDLNPVAYLILKATLEYPQKFGRPGSREVPEYIRKKDAEAQSDDPRQNLYGSEGEWTKSYRENPLATDVRYWGEWVLERAREELAEFYPPDEGGKTPVAYLWARTVTCTNPTCRAEVPLVRQWWLAKKKNKRIALKPIVDEEAKRVRFEVVRVEEGETWPDAGTIHRGNAVCPVCGTAIPAAELQKQAQDGTWSERLMAVVLVGEGWNGKSYRAAMEADEAVFRKAAEHLEELKKQESPFAPLPLLPTADNETIPYEPRAFTPCVYGFKTWGQLFNARQALALVTFAKWVRKAHAEVLRATQDEEYARAVGTYLGLSVDRTADYLSSLCLWHNSKELVSHTFGRQALPMVWDYIEVNPIANGSGD